MRKSETVVVPKGLGDGRDDGKLFLITEMPAAQAEKWAMRAFLVLKGSGERIPENVSGMGMVGIAIIGLNVFLQGTVDPAQLEPLLDEMFTCVQAVRDQRHPTAATAVGDYIEEVQTRLWLRSEVIRVHVNFSPAEALSKLISVATTPISPDT